MVRAIILAALLIGITAPANAHKLIEPGVREGIAKGAFSAAPASVWNRLSEKEGKFQEIWTTDGDQLNRLIFFGGIPSGEPLLKERNRKLDPLPRFAANMLLPDIPVLFERTYRAFYATPSIAVGAMEPTTFAGQEGIRFTYRYVDTDDEVERRGEAFAVIRNRQLYMVTFEAPSLFYFDRDTDAVRRLIGTVALTR